MKRLTKKEDTLENSREFMDKFQKSASFSLSVYDKLQEYENAEEEGLLSLKKGQAVAFDFDGIIHKYSKGWQDGSIYDCVNPEMVKLIHIFQSCEIPVFVLSTRNAEQIKYWWEKHINMPCKIIEEEILFYNDTKIVGITNKKLPAQLYIDDRAYRCDIFTTVVDFFQKIKIEGVNFETM